MVAGAARKHQFANKLLTLPHAILKQLQMSSIYRIIDDYEI
mgnify:CR=1 FL=1